MQDERSLGTRPRGPAAIAVLAVALLLLGSCVTPPSELATRGPGMIIPLYIYPADHRGLLPEAFRAVATLAEENPELQILVVVNPANGPGETVDPNYRRAVRRLSRSGAGVLGYVASGFGERPVELMEADVARWDRLYPGVSGIFLDELLWTWERPEYEGRVATVARSLRAAAADVGLGAIVVNPGTPVPWFYYEDFDVIVTYERPDWPASPRDLVPPSVGRRRANLASRTGVLIYGEGVWNRERFEELAEEVGFLFVNDHDLDIGNIRSYPWSFLAGNMRQQAKILKERRLERP